MQTDRRAPNTALTPDPQLLTRLAWECRWMDRARSQTLAEQVLEITEAQSDEHALARASALRTLAWQAKWRGDFEATASFCLQAKQRVDPTAARAILVDVYSLLGVIHYSAGRRDFAGRMVQRGLNLLDESVPAEGHVDIHITRSTILRYRGRMEEARQALEVAWDHASGAEKARVEHNIARAHIHDSAAAKAAQHAETALELGRRFNSRVILPYALEVLGAALIQQGAADKALPHLEEGLALARTEGDRRACCQILKESGHAHHLLGNPQGALDHLTEGQAIAKEMGYPLWLTAFSEALGAIYEEAGEYQKAALAYKEVVALQNAIRD
ncbi:tetratricopeptide repeat protein [Dinoroseobacter sp. PD6]|uniref:tetratricopeptide repeat protein n=1 Tax=Dinoroseobacter sp. PD6 TaxID=3028384 RepID=UPI00237B1324|nr:tetratricopeptide repeat protein [Dinoroseobacter sp. PD6]MDD9717872.1 tetratricopeptide repeat protein [Dinoroseobacter sp. PD6]